MCLLLGAALVALTGGGPRPGETMREDEAVAQVMSAARRIVAAGELRDVGGGYAFMPCDSSDGPPYQVTMHLTFAVPEDDRRLDTVVDRLVADGWVPGADDSKLSDDGVIALLDRPDATTGFATAKLYGECRVGGDHRRDDPAWTEVDF
ncbi:hypothetical protein BHQ18_10775 [Mycolicibacterium flavescens]|uniref:Lipoprotein LppJ n=2 Tax=Mycolicibacterium flavescens TaxID=1776 RepID=A0A1E3RL61_MYCFV|nr:hypothetical protein BHQ18_10775 [Mycolicibacterium flavescens]